MDEKKFETARTKKFMAGELPSHDRHTIDQIEKFGCSIINVVAKGHGLGWSYTIGVFDTCGKPDLITVGLPPETANSALNEAVRLLRSGVDLSQGRHRELVGNVECEFRAVDPKWIRHLMGWAVWYYEGDNFPVLQAVYPDLENRFPEEAGFDQRFEQPLMQPGTSMTRVTNDFWASCDPKSSLFDWKFADPPHTRVFLSKTVNEGSEPVTFVSHDAEDGAWQFLGDSMSDSGAVVVCFHHPIDSDATLVELADLPLGWYAERNTVGAAWIRRKREDEVVD